MVEMVTSYLIELEIDTPPIDFTAIMDTGSDLIWTQCRPSVSYIVLQDTYVGHCLNQAADHQIVFVSILIHMETTLLQKAF